MNVFTSVGTEKVKAKNTPKNQASLLEEDSKDLFGKTFRKHVVATVKAKKESKEVYKKSRTYENKGQPWKSKRPFGKIFHTKEGTPSQHDLTSTKSTLSRVSIKTPTKTSASHGTETISRKRNRKFSTCRKTAIFFRKLESTDKGSKNFRMGVWSKNRLHGGTISGKVSSSGTNVITGVRTNKPRG